MKTTMRNRLKLLMKTAEFSNAELEFETTIETTSDEDELLNSTAPDSKTRLNVVAKGLKDFVEGEVLKQKKELDQLAVAYFKLKMDQ